MKILHRYILARFLSAFLVFFLLFTGLFILVELFELKDSAAISGESASTIASYLLLRIPFLAYASSPVAVILATIFVMAARAHHAEIVAAQAGGIALLRYAAPILSVSAALSLLLLAGAEFGIPGWADRADYLRRVVIQKKAPPRAEYLDMAFAARGRFVLADFFIPSDRILDSVTVITPAPDGANVETISRYARLRFDEARGWVEPARDTPVDLPPPQAIELVVASGGLKLLADKPMESVRLSHLAREVDELSSLERRDPSFQRIHFEKAAREVKIHSKIAFPLSVPFLAMMGAGLGARIGRRRGLGAAVGSALFCTLGYMILLQAAIRLGDLAARTPETEIYAAAIPWLMPLTIAALAWKTLSRRR